MNGCQNGQLSKRDVHRNVARKICTGATKEACG
jgi:hypothetical protein